LSQGPRLLLLAALSATILTSVSCGSIGPQAGAPAVSSVPTVTSPIDISQPWATANASDVGFDPAKLSQAVAEASAIPRLQSFLIVRHGKLVSETYLGGTDASTPFDVRSATKSVLSLLVGQAIDEGVLPGLDTPIGSYLGSPYVLDSGDASVTVRDLLTMSSGYEWNEWTGNDYNLWIESSNHVQYLLDRPQTTPPAGFTYDSAAVHVLGVTLQAATKTYLPDLAQARLFGPIGVTSASWELLDRHTVNGGSGIQLRGRDLLRVGQLALQQGRSGTTQVVPAHWIGDLSTARYPWRDTDGAQQGVSYGYLWWVADAPAVPAFFAWGYGGQFIYVVPSLDLVVVTTTNWRNLAADNLTPVGLADTILNVIVNDVLPAAGPG
jgi:CubicO group peptidase (beta-lactamase class C family)